MRRAALTALLLMTAIADRTIAQSLGGGAIAPPLSPRNASYTIRASLDPVSRSITASETIVWRNITSKPATELQFHLYWNAWKDAKSTFMRERALGTSTDQPRAAHEWGRIDVTSMRLTTPSQSDLTALQRFIAPDDGNTEDRTVVSAPLPQPIEPGGTATIEIAWTAHVPRTIARTGAIGNFFFIAQWFPKLGVLQDEGCN